MFVDDHMRSNPITIPQSAPIARATALMDQHRVRHLPVLDEGTRLVGILADRDLRGATLFGRQVDQQLAVSEVMTAEPITISVDAALEAAISIFCKRRIGALPVMRGDALVGILTRHDVLTAFHQVLGLDEPGCRIEVALPDPKADLAAIFTALRTCDDDLISAVMSKMRRDGGEPALYLRVAARNPRSIEQHLRNAAVIVLEPEGS